MRYFLAWFLPPLALLLVGKPFQATANLLLCLTLVGIPIAMIWAFVVVAGAKADKRNRKLVAALDRQTRAIRRRGR